MSLDEVFGKTGEKRPKREKGTARPHYYKLWVPRDVYARIEFACRARAIRPAALISAAFDKLGIPSAESAL